MALGWPSRLKTCTTPSPDRLPVENLSHGRGVVQHGRSAVLALDGLFQLVDADFHAAVFSVVLFLYTGGGHATRAATHAT